MNRTRIAATAIGLAGALVALDAGLAEQALGLLQAPGLERLLCLSQGQPTESEHGVPPGADYGHRSRGVAR